MMKTYFNLGNQILSITVIFWILETLIFIILQGWHLRATTHAEKVCDFVANFGFMLGFICYFLAFKRVTEYMIQIFDILGEDVKEKGIL